MQWALKHPSPLGPQGPLRPLNFPLPAPRDSDLIFPSWLAGEWRCHSCLRDLRLPLGPRFARPEAVQATQLPASERPAAAPAPSVTPCFAGCRECISLLHPPSRFKRR